MTARCPHGWRWYRCDVCIDPPAKPVEMERSLVYALAEARYWAAHDELLKAICVPIPFPA